MPEPLAPLNHSYTALDLMDMRQPEAIIEGVFHLGDIMLLHGTEESFKSFLVMQMAESLCTATALFGHWHIPQRWRVGLLETEMHPSSMGNRLRTMFPQRDAPPGLVFMHNDVLKKWRRCSLEGKFKVIEEWVRVQSLDIIILDTVNDFFRGKDDPSSETVAGKFFDELRSLGLKGAVCVRHDRKMGDDDSAMHSNERIRGSAEFKEDPEVILFLNRVDKRVHQVHLDIGKLRYGRKPDALSLWFDASNMRLTALPPVIAALLDGPQPRMDLLTAMKDRFDLGQSRVDDMLKAESLYLRETMSGHNKVFAINWMAAESAPWAVWLPEGSMEDIQPCVNVPVAPVADGGGIA